MSDLKDLLQPVQDNAMTHLGEQWLNEVDEGEDFRKFRRTAFEAFQNCPMPTTRDEFWKYTRVAPALKDLLQSGHPANAPEITSQAVENGAILVFVNGVFQPEKSNTKGFDFEISPLNEAKKSQGKVILEFLKSNQREDYFSLMADGLHNNGVFIRVPKSVSVETPVTIHHVFTGDRHFGSYRNLVVLETGSQVKLVEQITCESAKGSTLVGNSDYLIEANAQLEVNKIQAIGADNNLIGQDFAQLQRDARASFNTVTMEGALIRNNLHVDLNGENAICYLNGLYMLKGKQHADNHTIIRHAVPHCESHELYKGILNESSRGVFNGKVMVMPHAQKTNAFQSNANILLTDEAQVYSKPELEIYADDVKCSHGSTTGQLNDEALFYLQARGLGKDAARNLLLYAFAKEVLERLTISGLKKSVDAYISKRYHTHVND